MLSDVLLHLISFLIFFDTYPGIPFGIIWHLIWHSVAIRRGVAMGFGFGEVHKACKKWRKRRDKLWQAYMTSTVQSLLDTIKPILNHLKSRLFILKSNEIPWNPRVSHPHPSRTGPPLGVDAARRPAAAASGADSLPGWGDSNAGAPSPAADRQGFMLKSYSILQVSLYNIYYIKSITYNIAYICNNNNKINNYSI